MIRLLLLRDDNVTATSVATTDHPYNDYPYNYEHQIYNIVYGDDGDYSVFAHSGESRYPYLFHLDCIDEQVTISQGNT